jgi:8-oxo-dGTP diphosphatase
MNAKNKKRNEKKRDVVMMSGGILIAVKEVGMSQDIHVISRGVIVKDGKVLVCENKKKHFYYLPGGHVEHGESSAVALERELQEELGVRCVVGRFLGCFEYSFIPVVGKCHNHEINLLFMIDAPTLASARAPQALEEPIAFTWIPLAELESIDFKPQPLPKLMIQWLMTDYHEALVTLIE